VTIVSVCKFVALTVGLCILLWYRFVVFCWADDVIENSFVPFVISVHVQIWPHIESSFHVLKPAMAAMTASILGLGSNTQNSNLFLVDVDRGDFRVPSWLALAFSGVLALFACLRCI
jgi:hypothetical protein